MTDLIAHWAESLAVAAGWLVLVVRFATAYRSDTLQSQRQNGLVLRMWLTLLFIVLAGTFHHPQIRLLYVSYFGPRLAFMPSTAAAITAYLLACGVCFELAPSKRPPFAWHILGGVLTILTVSWLKAGIPGQGSADPRAHAYGDVMFSTYIAVVALTLVLPSVAYSRAQERHPVMKLRLRIMAWTHWVVVVWMGNSITRAFSVLVPFSFNSRPIYVLSLLGFLVTFLLAYLMPTSVLRRVLSGLRHLALLGELIVLRHLHRAVYRTIPWKPARISPSAFILRPNTALYLTVIDLFDAMLPLRQCGGRHERQLLEHIEEAANPELSYSQTRRRLRRGQPGANLHRAIVKLVGLEPAAT